MKGAVFRAPGNFELEELPDPQVKTTEILIQVKACGICGTDEHIINGTAPASPPVVLGHEYAGVVTAVGKGTKKFKIGDRVAVDPNITCGKCEYCLAGKPNLCRNLKALGVNINGGFAEFSVLPAAQAYKLSASVSFEEAVLVEPLACCVHGIELIEIKRGETVFILGGGTIGLLMLQLTRLAGAGRIIVSEPVSFKRRLAKKLGADQVVDPAKDNLPLRLAEVAIECAGAPMTVKQSFELVKHGGRILLFGLVSSQAEVSIRPAEIVKRELTVKGSVLNPYTHHRALELISKKQVKVLPLITNRFPLTKIKEAFRTHKDKSVVKVLII